jgi:hypothetical protein
MHQNWKKYYIVQKIYLHFFFRIKKLLRKCNISASLNDSKNCKYLLLRKFYNLHGLFVKSLIYSYSKN